eukprot:scaffold15515_cov104-Isochrysis_galbana.AAC.5
MPATMDPPPRTPSAPSSSPSSSSSDSTPTRTAAALAARDVTMLDRSPSPAARVTDRVLADTANWGAREGEGQRGGGSGCGKVRTKTGRRGRGGGGGRNGGVGCHGVSKKGAGAARAGILPRGSRGSGRWRGEDRSPLQTPRHRWPAQTTAPPREGTPELQTR